MSRRASAIGPILESMGFEASYQCLPADSVLLERARNNEECGALLCLLSSELRGVIVPMPTTNAERAFNAEAAKLCERRPGIEQRRAYVDSRWDALHYLLSEPYRRARDIDGADLGTATIRGEAEIGPYATAGQGLALRYTSPETVRAIARHYRTFSRGDVFAHLDPRAMEEACVYKFFADRCDETELDYLWARFEELRRFYDEALRHGEGALVIID